MHKTVTIQIKKKGLLNILFRQQVQQIDISMMTGKSQNQNSQNSNSQDQNSKR